MKENIPSSYVLDLSRVTGLARKAILLVVLHGMKSLGYKWTLNPLAPLDITRLIINRMGDTREIMFDNEPVLSTYGHATIFDFNQVEDFLRHANEIAETPSSCLSGIILAIHYDGHEINLA